MMRARNGPETWGLVSRALHWLMAAGLLAMLPFGLWLARTQPSLGTLWLYGLHKSLGVMLLVLVLLRLVWHRLSPPPVMLSEGVAPWQLRLAATSHRALYALMLAVPLAGWSASSATGIDTVLFGRWTLPRIAPVSEAWDRRGFALHLWLSVALAVLVAIHVAGALWRHWGHRDATLRRMLGWA
ncbi:putative cytochrome b561 [Rubellimicrobium mesophilum DSM 19309]|uniref:Putative cytochrome b561 n=1 Tax=Rubellimicrobium mesophilum DSM 19309 TaxID=442562 RepID=A0A017HL41_9RHOB|nr:cytochrome b/b6 domain-containing protein [Rubellimicrobium mesophilum]EYD75036.1 putative cytochrome b561 [Rubellimicrobium mesophilum DSM 19309]